MSTTIPIPDFMELNESQIQEIQSALTEADRGEFATEEQVADIFRKWSVNAD